MKKILNLINKIKKIKIKRNYYRNIKTIIISFFTTILTLILFLFLVWFYRDSFLNFIAEKYSFNQKNISSEPILIEEIKEVPVIKEVPKKDEDTVITAVKKAKPAVVSIIVTKDVVRYDIKYEDNKSDSSIKTPIYVPNGTESKKIGNGSGFLISSNGMIVTNKHVVDMVDAKYTVLLNSGAEYQAKLLAKDSVLDVAILKIEGSGFPYLNLADSDKLEIGETVIAIGNALGEFKNTVSVGVVSGLSRSLLASDNSGRKKEFLYKVIQTDTAINPGNSGGPLLNIKGEVVGINVAIAEDSSNIGFSLPINIAKNIIDQVKKTGKILRPYVGVRYIPVDKNLQTKLNLPVSYGILVKKGSTESELAVMPNSPASKVGIMEDDIILSVDGELINQNNDFMSLIRYKNIGDKIVLIVLSGGKEKILTLKLEQAPEGM